MKVKWLKLFGLILLDIFVIGIVIEMGFKDEYGFYLPSFIVESVIYSFKHFSFLGLTGAIGMVFLPIMFLFMATNFIVFNWHQFKSCFQFKKEDTHRK